METEILENKNTETEDKKMSPEKSDTVVEKVNVGPQKIFEKKHLRPKRSMRRVRERRQREKPEFEHKIINIRRVARVVAGGRRFSFSVASVAGDRKGRVGVGLGKAGDTAYAIQKSLQSAKRNMITVPLTENHTIRHEVEAKFCASHVFIKPRGQSGLVAGSSVRAVLELAGIQKISAKIISRSKDKLNNARATVTALKKLSK